MIPPVVLGLALLAEFAECIVNARLAAAHGDFVTAHHMLCGAGLTLCGLAVVAYS